VVEHSGTEDIDDNDGEWKGAERRAPVVKKRPRTIKGVPLPPTVVKVAPSRPSIEVIKHVPAAKVREGNFWWFIEHSELDVYACCGVLNYACSYLSRRRKTTKCKIVG
jgi:hypothetical protein